MQDVFAGTAAAPSRPGTPAGPSEGPWLSVLIPAFNVQTYLEESVGSVLAQADADVEVLIVDDCSTDGTADLMSSLAAADARVRCLRHAQNQGVSVTRNTLLDHARGRYVWFLDADDYLAPGAIAQLRRIIDEHAPSLLMCDYRMVREFPKLKHRLRGDPRKHTFEGPRRQRITDASTIMAGTFRGGQMHPWSKIARRELWGTDLRFPPGRHFEDMHLLPFLALRAPDLWYEPAVWVIYRQRQGSIMHTLNARKADDLAWAMNGLREAVQASGRHLDDQAAFAWANTLARNFIGAARMAQRFDPQRSAELIGGYRRQLEAASPWSPDQLLKAYFRKGWWARALRLRYWLQRAAATGARSHSA